MSAGLDAANNAASLIVDRHISENKGHLAAIRFRDKRYSYHDLAALMNRAGNMMRRLGVNAGDSVLVAVAPSPSLLASILGAMKIGALPLLLPSDTSAGATEALIRGRKPKLVIAGAARAASLQQAGNVVVVVGEAGEGQRSFVQEMRESASSLTKSSVANGAAALAFRQADKVISVSHEQLAGACSQPPPAIEFEGWNLGEALMRLARGEEEIIR